MALTGWSATNYLSRAAPITARPLAMYAWGTNTEDGPAGMLSLSEALTAGGAHWRFMLIRGGDFGLRAEEKAATSTFDVADTTAVPVDGSWFVAQAHFVGASLREAQVDGAAFASGTATINPNAPTSFFVGRGHSSNFPTAYAGAEGLAEVSVWDTTGFSAADRRSLDTKIAAGQSPMAIDAESGQPWEGALVEYWRLEDDTDLTGLKQGLTLLENGTLTTFASHPAVDDPPPVEPGAITLTGSQRLEGTPPCRAGDIDAGGGGLSFAMWFRADSIRNAAMMALWDQDAADNRNYITALVRDAAGNQRLNLTIRNLDNTQTLETITTTTYTAGVWHLASGFISKARRTIFLDGAGKDENATAITNFNPVDLLKIGDINGATFGQQWQGALYSLCFWYGELTDQQHADMAAGAHPLTIAPEKVADWYELESNAPTKNPLRPIYPLTVVGSLGTAPEPSIDAYTMPEEWSTPTKLFDNGASQADCDLAYDKVTGRLHAVGKNSGVMQTRYSDDEGATWSTPVTVPNAGVLQPSSNHIAASNGKVYLLTRDTSATVLQVHRSLDGGDTWETTPATLPGWTTASIDDRVHLKGYLNTVHVFHGRAGANPNPPGIFYWRSTDAAASFGSRTTLYEDANAEGSPGGLAVDQDIVYAAFDVDTNQAQTLNRDTRLRRSTDGGATWEATVDPGTHDGDPPYIRTRPWANESGKVAIIYEVALDFNQSAAYPNATDGEVGFIYSEDEGVTWAPHALATDRPDDYLSHPEGLMDPSGAIHALAMAAIDQVDTTADPDNFRVYRFSPDGGQTWGLHQQVPRGEVGFGVGYVESSPNFVHNGQPTGFYTRRSLADVQTTQLLAASLAGAGTVAAAVEVTRPLSTSIAGAGSVAASLEASRLLSAALGGAGALAASLEVQRPLSTSLAGAGALAASLSTTGAVELSASLSGAGDVTAQVVITRELGATLSGAGSQVAALEVSRGLAGALAGSGALGAGLEVQRLLVAELAGAGGVSGRLALGALVVPLHHVREAYPWRTMSEASR